MSFTVIDVAQRSPEWFAARCGRLTGSSAGDMLAKVKSGEAAGRRNLRVRLVLERLTGHPQEDGYSNDAMERGIEKEPDAMSAYEVLTGLMTWPVGFMAHTELMAGCSPDGLVDGGRGLLELKCLKSANHLECVRAGVIPPKYMPQLIHNLWISGSEWCDFVSFDDRFPQDLRIVRYRLLASEVDLGAYELAARMFLSEVEKETKELTDRAGAVA